MLDCLLMTSPCLIIDAMQPQFTGQKHLHADMPTATKLEDGDEVTEGVVQESLRLALGWMSALQAEDGHWPGDFSGIMYIMPFWVRVTYPHFLNSLVPIHAVLHCQGKLSTKKLFLIRFFCSDLRAAHHRIDR
jgi:hypothetical protein